MKNVVKKEKGCADKTERTNTQDKISNAHAWQDFNVQKKSKSRTDQGTAGEILVLAKAFPKRSIRNRNLATTK